MVISVHGIRTDGEWQRQISPCFEGIGGLAYRMHRYGKVAFYEPALPMKRDQVVEDFARFYEREVTDGISPSVIAHSYGTWIVCTAMERFLDIRFDRVILCGSVVACDYDWMTRFTSGQVGAARNELAGDDATVRKLRQPMIRRFLPNSGPSGLDGFDDPPRRLEQRVYPKFRHSDMFIMKAHCEEVWRPFIFGHHDFADLCRRYLQKIDGGEFARLCLPVLERMIRFYFRRELDDVGRAVLAQSLLRSTAQYGKEGTYSADEIADMLVRNLWKEHQTSSNR
jgi:pimeloyl-ACP methyl ester carboxylesterase